MKDVAEKRLVVVHDQQSEVGEMNKMKIGDIVEIIPLNIKGRISSIQGDGGVLTCWRCHEAVEAKEYCVVYYANGEQHSHWFIPSELKGYV